MVWDAGNAAGSRPPTGFDSYMKSTKKKASKADIRDLAMSICFELIQKHQECLESCDARLVLVNEDDGPETDKSSSAVAEEASSKFNDYLLIYDYYPFLHRAIDDLANAAAFNISGSCVEQYKWSDRIHYAAAAFVLQAQLRSQAPLDARLTQFAVSKLVSCLCSGPAADKAVSFVVPESFNENKNKKPESLQLDQPLPVPSIMVAKASRKQKAKERFSFCSFAGVYEHSIGAELSCDEKFALFLRAMNGDEMKETGATISALSSHLICILEKCYDTRPTTDSGIKIDSAAVANVIPGSAEEKKRKADSTSVGKRKRQKGGKHSKKKIQEPAVEERSTSHYR
jgi:hypothetical protein